MLKASVAVALVAYATFFAYLGVGEVEAAPAGPPAFGLASLFTEVGKSVEEYAKIITKLITGLFDFSDSSSGLLKLISDGISKSFVSINNSNNKNNHNSPKLTTEPTNLTIPTTEESFE